ncbi:hypothetical protein PYW07_006160 [Mythimna separata]|uniref:Splicing factor Cactin n=1 Tax=Mythimna separata TaxID=271217 RepID=A0AAD8DSS8_MYTSE|nr:hypothetical protein PYW07_006160 [Mythimna separata]
MSTEARHLRKRQEKERKCRERLGWDNEYSHYTNKDNPFGDPELTNTFVWTKKLAKQGVETMSRDELEALNRQKQLQIKTELRKLKQRRLERATENEARAADAAARHDGTCTLAEDAFLLQQARLRAQIRIQQRRAKPIDLLANYVTSEDGEDAPEMHEPCTYINGLQSQDLEDLLEDIKVYKELENNANQAYWEDVQTVAQDELDKLRRPAAPDTRRDAVHQAVAGDVTQIFKDKSVAQLEVLQAQVERKLCGREDGVNVAYWESLLAQLKGHTSRARLHSRHQRRLQRAPQRAAAPEPGEPSGLQSSEVERATEPAAAAAAHGSDAGAEQCRQLYRAARYSPAPLSPRALPPGARLLDAEQDAAYLTSRRAAFVQTQPAVDTDRARTTGAARDEAHAPVEHSLGSQACAWRDQFRPRKPRYFNRVQTGWEWHKYNQTHYGADSPPPRAVLGYQFNILYPDLVDKRATPHYYVEACPENPELAVIRFEAGAPYEDIAFRIVRGEWERAARRGFRCRFVRGALQLCFRLKRRRYRR